jgi:predicted amidohydrolase YtcJ
MMVLPGFHDAHVHPVSGGVELSQCDLNDLASVDALLAKIGQCSDALPKDAWLVGGGWDLSLFPEANPKKELLDAVAGERPVALGGADGHSTWVNTRALAMAGIDAATPNPPQGIIERDPTTGDATGTLRESAQGLVRAVLPPVSAAEREQGLTRALAMANGFGITSLIEAAADRDTAATYQALADRGALTVRVVQSVELNTPNRDALVNPGDRASGRSLRLDAVKIFVDGVLEGETAALLEPYARGGVGELNLTPEALSAAVTELDARNLQVHMHAIGDRAVRAALDAVAAARAANGVRDNRHHIAHLQLIDPADYPRFAELGVAANFQALWAFPDAYITGVNLPAVGQARVDRMYPIGALHRAGARIVGGSDWSVSSMNPLLAIETAVTRRDPTGRVDGVLNADNAVGLDVMLAAYTKNGAWLMHQEDAVGTIAPGKFADLVILDRNLFEIPPAEISDAKVVRTMLAGETVFAR